MKAEITADEVLSALESQDFQARLSIQHIQRLYSLLRSYQLFAGVSAHILDEIDQKRKQIELYAEYLSACETFNVANDPEGQSLCRVK